MEVVGLANVISVVGAVDVVSAIDAWVAAFIVVTAAKPVDRPSCLAKNDCENANEIHQTQLRLCCCEE